MIESHRSNPDTLKETLQEALRKQLHHSGFDIKGVIAIPNHGDQMVRLRTLQETLEESHSEANDGMVEYLVQLAPKRDQANPVYRSEIAETKTNAENIYLPTGKLNIPYLSKNADLLFESGDYPLARNIYNTMIQSGECTGSALFRIGKCYEAEGKLQEAQSNYEESIVYYPTLEAYQKLGALLIQQRKDKAAAEILERALNLKGLSAMIKFELHKAIGNCWTRSKKFDPAQDHFKKALELDPAADEIRSNLGALCLQENRIAEAKRHFQDAIASNPKNHQALAGLGSCFFSEGDKHTAYQLLTQSLELELNNPTAIFYLINCAYEIKSYANAVRILEEYIQISPVNTNLMYSLAGLQFHLGRLEEAKATIQDILELQPDHLSAKELRGMIEKY